MSTFLFGIIIGYIIGMYFHDKIIAFLAKIIDRVIAK